MAAKFKIVNRCSAKVAPAFRISTGKFPIAPEPPAPPKVEQGRKLLRFDAQIDIGATEGKTFKVVKNEAGVVTDYQDVTVKGYLSTFGNSDRDGEIVRKGAFKDTIAEFMRNPVMLMDHSNKIATLIGSFNTVREDTKGLYVEGQLSNSPSDFMRHVRALVAEGHLKTMSMGGIFYTEANEIFKVSLFEGSLVPIPANPQAIISVRECTEHEAKRWQFEERQT